MAQDNTASGGTPQKETEPSNPPRKTTTTPSSGKAKSATQKAKAPTAAKSSATKADPKPTASSAQKEETSTSTSAPTSEKKKSGSGRFAWTLVFLLLFFIGGVGATPYLLPQVLPMLPQQAHAYFAPLMASSGAADTADLTAKINQIDAGLKDVRQVAEAAQDAAQNAVREASERPAPTPSADVSQITTRIDALASQVEQVSSAQADQSDAYARLQSSLEELPAGEGSSGVSPAALAALKTRLEDETSARDGLTETIAALRGDLEALKSENTASTQQAASAEALSDVATALRERLTRAEERLDLVAQAADSAAAPEALDSVNSTVTDALSGFETRLAALESVRQQATAAMVAGLETARLAQAVGNGRAYAAELRALTQLKSQAGPALPDISDLLEQIAPFADNGIPSGATLSAQLEERSREILTAIDTPDGANWWQSLLARIRNLVTVRKVGAGTQGAAPPDVLARAETAARKGEWGIVVNEISALPQAAQDAFGLWWDHAQARATAQRALADLSARLGVAVSDTDAQDPAELR